jgi:cytochrome c oxidase subunit II
VLTTPFAVFIASTLIIVGVFAAVALSTRRPGGLAYTKANRLRAIALACLGAVLVTFLVLTLPHLPYSVDARTPDHIVHAVGKQYAWSLTEGAGPSLQTWDSAFSPTVTVPVGASVEFRVTTLDVNHGFSLYTPDGHLMAQTQAMPGYVNRLRVTFDQPGTYSVLCLEFCGMSHHRMRGVVEVR